MLALMSEVAENEVREALSLPPERLQCLLSKLAYYPDNPDFIAEIVNRKLKWPESFRSFTTHACELLVRDGRVWGDILLGRVMKSGVPVPAMHECLLQSIESRSKSTWGRP